MSFVGCLGRAIRQSIPGSARQCSAPQELVSAYRRANRIAPSGHAVTQRPQAWH